MGGGSPASSLEAVRPSSASELARLKAAAAAPVECSEESWPAFETACDSRFAAAAKTTGVDVSGSRKTVGSSSGGGPEHPEDAFSAEQRKLFRQQRTKAKVRKRKAKKDALDVSEAAPAWMARADDDGRGGGGGGVGSFLGSSGNPNLGGAASSSKKARLLKPRPGDQHPSSGARPGKEQDRSEAEDALAAWKKYREKLG